MVDYLLQTAMILTTFVSSTMMLRNPYVFKLYCICLFVLIPNNVFSFTASNSCPSSFLGSKSSSFLLQSSRRPVPQTKVESLTPFDPMNFEALDGTDLRPEVSRRHLHSQQRKKSSPPSSPPTRDNSAAVLATTAVSTSLAMTSFSKISWAQISEGSYDPSTFQPICPASDNFYRFLQGTTEAVVGQENFNEYGPLIAGGLLRIRLELCVVESFFTEAVLPFVQKKGLGWILPLHETVETFLAGVVFALAATFILVGSTKILTVIIFYADLLIGSPFRLLGGFANDRAMGKPVTLDIGLGPLKKRVVGPPDTKSEQKDISEVAPVDVAIIALSGGMKYAGQAIGVGSFL